MTGSNQAHFSNLINNVVIAARESDKTFGRCTTRKLLKSRDPFNRSGLDVQHIDK